MFNFLVNKYIKSKNFNNKENRDKLIRLTGVMGLFINLILFIIKIFIGLISNSISIISDAINNLTDILPSIITIYASIKASKPADEEHPFGHGRYEYIASLTISFIIPVIGLQLLIQSIRSLFNPSDLSFSIYTILILFISIILKLYMYLYNKRAYKLIESSINKAISKDSLNDIMITSLVLVSILISYIFNIDIDAYIGIFISLVIIKSGIDIYIEMVNKLLGKKISQKTIDKLKKTILSAKYIKGVHNIELHEYGIRKLYGSCHVEAPANIDTYTMHKIINNIEEEILDKYDINISIHVDPNYLLEKDEFNSIKDKEKLKDIDL